MFGLEGTLVVVDATVVIPAFNAAAFLADALESVARQATQPAGGVIVVDDGSSDDTAGVASRHGARVIRQGNAGPATARNAGIRAASTPWIALLDADDLCTEERFSVQAAAIARAGASVAVLCGQKVQGGVVMPTGDRQMDFAALWHRNTVSTSTVMLRRRAWEAVGGFDEARELIGVEDYNLWLRLAHAGWEIVAVPQTLAEYRPSDDSLTRQTRRFAEAELHNVDALEAALGLDAAMALQKKRALLGGYATELFHFRDRTGARDLFRRAAGLAPLGWRERIRLWATWLPLKGR